jgi:heterodisulfide reductase subunit A
MSEDSKDGNGKVPPCRIGVYLCHCGTNISKMVDVTRIAKALSEHPDVAVARDYKFMCSEPGQELIIKDIKEQNLNRVAVARVKFQKPLERRRIDVTKRVMVVGGGIAGIEAALQIADAGFEVILVEKEESIGGHMAKFDKTFPTLDCAACILTPKMVSVGKHPNIRLLSYAEIEEVEGYVGNFKIKVRKKARYVDPALCNSCGSCYDACPSHPFPSEVKLIIGGKVFKEGIRLKTQSPHLIEPLDLVALATIHAGSSFSAAAKKEVTVG